jgi:hypothetical protein
MHQIPEGYDRALWPMGGVRRELPEVHVLRRMIFRPEQLRAAEGNV